MLPGATHLRWKRLIDSILPNFIFLLFIYLVLISAQSLLQSVSDNDAFEPKYCKKLVAGVQLKILSSQHIRALELNQVKH